MDKETKNYLDGLSARIASLEKDKVSYVMPHDVRENIQRAIISQLQYMGAISGVASPVMESTPSLMQIGYNGKLFNIPINANITSGAGSPGFDAPKGTLYINTTATTAATRLWINVGGATVWATFTASA